MTAAAVIDLYDELEHLGVMVWADGGWGVDALLGEQTRIHRDLDIAVEEKHVPKLRQLLEARWYAEIKLEQARPWNFVLADAEGRELDIHVIVIDEQGNVSTGLRRTTRCTLRRR